MLLFDDDPFYTSKKNRPHSLRNLGIKASRKALKLFRANLEGLSFHLRMG
jgi:hypothetical protein